MRWRASNIGRSIIRRGFKATSKKQLPVIRRKSGKTKANRRSISDKIFFFSRYLIFKVAETLKKVAKAEEVVSKVEEEEEVEEKDIDLFSESAMYNAYGICHNVQVE